MELLSKVKKATYGNIVQGMSRVELGKRALESLGLNDRVYCVVDGDHDVYFIKDWAVLLHHVLIEDPISQVVVNTCQDHHKKYGCGSKTWMAMIHLLSQAVWQLVHKGVPIHCVIKLTREIFDDCVKYIQSLTVPVILENNVCHQSEDYCVYNEEYKRKEPSSVELIDYSESEMGLNDNDSFIEIPLYPKQTQSSINKESQKFCHTEYTFGTFTKETMVSDHGECKPVILVMKDIDIIEDGVDGNDVSWFFHTDDNVCATELDQSELIVPEDSIENLRYKENVTGRIETHDIIADNKNTAAISFPSCGSTDYYDSDFEDCISDDDITKSTIKVVDNLQTNEQNDCKMHVDEDEFDSCFSSSAESDIHVPEKLSSVDTQKVCNSHFNSNEPTGQISFPQVVKPENKEELNSQKSMETSMTSHRSYNEIQQLDKLLQEISVHKPSKSITNALNSSRHFKTFEAIENNLKSNIFCSSTKNGNKSLLKEVQNSDAKIPKVILNSSRHFQSFSSEHSSEKNEKKDSTSKNFISHPSGNDIILQNIELSKSPYECIGNKFENRSLKDKSMDNYSNIKPISTVEELGRSLCRNSSMMNYAMDCFVHNQHENSYKRFDRRLIFSTICKGPTTELTRLSDGLVLPCTTEDISLMKDCSLRALVINGDLKHTAHHKGYKQNLKGTQIRKTVEKGAKEQIWISDTLSRLEMLKIDVVFVKGLTDENFKTRLQSQNILVFDEVPYRALEIVTYVCAAVPLIYIHEAFEGNVCKDLKITPYDHRYLFERYTKSTLCHVSFTSSAVKTLVICHPCQHGCEKNEQDFWLCVNRLANAVADKKVLPGRGETERKCHQYLLNQLEQANSDITDTYNDARLFRPVILEQLSDVFRHFYETVENNLESSGNRELWTDDVNSDRLNRVEKEMPSISPHHFKEKHTSELFQPLTNSDTCLTSVPVFDNCNCKISCWRKTVDTVIDNLRTDVLIQTGVENNNIYSLDTFDKFV